MTRPVDIDRLEAEIAALNDLSFTDLKARYADLAGDPPPKRIGRKLLILAVAYEMQRKAFGVRTDRLMGRLGGKPASETKIANRAPASSKESAKRPIRSLKPGGRLVREWRGRTYEIYVADDGCYLDGARYPSLSAAAEAITGAKWNGPRFFGLRSPRVS
ncbi:MAG: DUF2924 domain-containing protein [Amphiplicatus sp.]